MDILKVLDAKLAQLPNGDHTKGLNAVRLHIEAAIGHLRRGQMEGDAGAFTDAIYRCNQAFEGSVKEAYRVLAGKNPERFTPARIEGFLSSGNVLRKRVLDQFTNYRTEWRNPSTHDYMLDFDEDEALLAIVSVSVFGAVLCGQIDTKITADIAQQNAEPPSEPVPASVPLLDEVRGRVLAFAQSYVDAPSLTPLDAYRHLEGTLVGQLAADFSTTSDVFVEGGFRVNGREADVAVGRGKELVAIEVKRMVRPVSSMVFSGLEYLSELKRRGFTDGVLLLYMAGDDNFASVEWPMPEGGSFNVILGAKLKGKLIEA